MENKKMKAGLSRVKLLVAGTVGTRMERRITVANTMRRVKKVVVGIIGMITVLQGKNVIM